MAATVILVIHIILVFIVGIGGTQREYLGKQYSFAIFLDHLRAFEKDIWEF